MSGPSRISSPGERILTAGAGPSSSSGLSPVGANAACAACKYQRRKCAADCPLAPYFPPDQPKRFLNVHRLFGVSSILRILRQVDPDKREDTVKSIVYEADTREKDPVHGCLGIIHLLQNQVYKLKEELQTTRESLYLLEQQHASSIMQQNFVHHQHAGSQANFYSHLQSQYNPSTSHHTGQGGYHQGGFHDSISAPGQIVSYQDSRAHAGYHDHSSRYLVSDQDSALQNMLGHSVKVESDPYNRSNSMGNMQRYVSDPGGGSLHLPDQQPSLVTQQQHHHHHQSVGGGASNYDLDRRGGGFNYNPLADTTPPPALDRHVDPLRSVAALQVLQDPLANHSSDPELRNAGVHLSLTNQYSI